MQDENAQHDFGILLGLAYQTFVARLHEHLRADGFTDIAPTYGYVLRAIADEPMNQRQLSKLLGITDQGTGKIVNEMERVRLVKRIADPEDARARVLTLGPRGRELLASARAFHAKFERQLARELGGAVATTRRVLEAIVGDADASAGRGPRRLRPM
jgi:DNA-binding MarR family transcriptional regulator